VLDPDPATHTASGITITLTAHDAQNFGDVCFINASREAAIADSSVIASSSALLMATATIAANAAGVYLVIGMASDASWAFSPVGSLLYLSITGTTGNTISTAAPTGANEVIQILGVAHAADTMFFNPCLVQIEHL
jgi:hypothetical protein